MKVVCASRNCKYSSDSEDSSRIIFINFPSDDTSKIWAHRCGRADLLVKSNEELHMNYYICSNHIEDRYYISKADPIIIEQHAVPTLFEPEIMSEKESTDIFDRTEDTEVNDNVTLSYCDMGAEIDQYHDIGIRFSNLCRICGEPTPDGIEIFSTKGIELKLKDKIGLHMPIAVSIEDLMPQRLCMDCYNKLEIAHSLVVTSLRTDMRLRRFLNIEGEPDYDNRYNAVVEECSLEVAEEMCMNESTESVPLQLSSNKDEEITVGHELTTELNHLDAEDIDKNDFEPPVRNVIHVQLSNFIESYNDVNNSKDNHANNSTESIPVNRETNETNKSQHLHYKDTLKTPGIFENHKLLCDEGEASSLQKDEGIINNKTNKNPGEMNIASFQFTSKSCDLCNQSFESVKLFNEHKFLFCKLSERNHCEIPDRMITGKENINTLKDLHGINSIKTVEVNKRCGHCDTVYKTKKELLTHITECHGGQFSFRCFACNKTYEKWSSLDVHEATHRADKPYLCDLCGKSFKHSNNLRGHKRTHLEESKKKRHVCEVCKNAFRSRFHLREHMNQHYDNKPYSCEECGKAFYKRIQLRQHKLSHGSNKHICPVCGVTFNRRGNMNTHLKRHNNGDGSYTCSVCACRCKSMSELKLHRKKHTEQDIIDSIKKKCINKTIWQCKICNRVFSKRAVLLNHERIHRGEKINFECDVCGKKLASKSSLIYHKKSIHSTERPHMCQYCGNSFVSKEARLIHERIHTGERPYACKICNMQYKCSSNLNQHMKIHLGIKPHKCTHCSKSFTRKGALNVHERVHTGVKPFRCDVCNRTFSQKNDMLKHTRTHDVKSMRCEHCDEVFTKKKDILKHIALHKQSNSVIQEYVEVAQVQPYAINITCSQIE